MKNNKEKSDIIRGHRMTDAESSRFWNPDIPMVDEKVLEEVCEPFSYPSRVGEALREICKRLNNINNENKEN